ncbi:glycerophosphodiester phosphodiesterase family protein [Paenibacillus sp. PL2-23]|uniref:glycerophosphodiester phosphodiesterase family protein n=1 Tax=Paenibacillus sp. PL2-23 TaxID=2100729 RepID=UPI0030F6C426
MMYRASKLLPVLLCAALLWGLIPVHAAAEESLSIEGQGTRETQEAISESADEDEPGTPEQGTEESPDLPNEELESGDLPHEEPLAEGTNAAVLERPSLVVPKTAGAPVIDGKLDDTNWSINEQVARALTPTQGEPLPAQAAFGVLWDHQYLYIGIRAYDSTPLQDMPGYWFQQDSISLFIDPTLHRSAPFASADLQAGFVYRDGSATPAFSFGAALSSHAGKDDKGIMRAIRKTDDGWELETAISWELLQFDPQLSRELGLEVSVTDRYGSDPSELRSSYWSAYQSQSFWNDTSGYGTLMLSEEDIVQGPSDPVLLEESFDNIPDGALPEGWISDTNAGSPPFAVSGGRLAFNGSASGKQSRVTAPVLWDNYVVEADIQFHSVLNAARWASIIFRGAAEGKQPYNQMAIRQNGTYEVAYRKPDNSWSVMASGPWQALALNEGYSMKVRVFDNNVKEYIKPDNETDFTLLMDRSFDSGLLQRGKIGFQGDQSHVSFDNLKVTRLTVDSMTLNLPEKLEALSGPLTLQASATFSDGLTENVPASRMKLYSSDENILRIVNGQLYPVQAGSAVLTAIYGNAEVRETIIVHASETGAKVVSLSHDQGYTLATVGSPIQLRDLTFAASFSDFSSGTVQGDEIAWSPSGDAVALQGDSLIALERGVHGISGQIDGVTLTLLVAAKSAGETDYVLYENSFDELADGAMPAGWTRLEGTTPSRAAVRDGAFELQASAAPDNPSRVMLPDYLSLFGDYRIEADVTHLAANEPTRWHSIMYRIQNSNYPYYQMAVRQDAKAANGVEFAERNPSNGWSIIDKGPFQERIDAGKMYRYTVIARGNRVQQRVNDTVIIDTDSAGGYLKGGIGLQANGSRMKVDNIRVTLQQEALPPLPSDRFADVYEPDTKIAMGPTVVMEISDVEGLESLHAPETPATVIMHINDQLGITTPSGTPIAEAAEVLEQLEGRIMPAFYVKSEEAADEAAIYAKQKGLEDAFIVSADGALIQRARAIMPMLRGILDFSQRSLTHDDLLDIRRETTISGSKIAILPEASASRDQVAYLQQRTIVVWTKEEISRAESALSKHRLIATGTNGLVTGSPETAFEALGVYNNEVTLIRKPYIIGHRGMPSKSPENTIESNLLAYENGADFIENDMFLTVDDHLVIIHDSVLQNTTNGSGSVESFTLEQIKELNANKPYPNGFPLVRVPTLEEQIELAREKGIMLYAEIKTGNPKAVDALVRIIREQNAEDLINVMSFSSSQLSLFAQQMPGMPVGLLVGSGSETDVNVGKALRSTLRTTQTLNATYNAGFIGMGQQYMEASKHRGIVISPWTINGLADYTSFFLRGVFGITTDYAYYSADWHVALEAEQESYTMKPGDKLTLKAIAEAYNRTTNEVTPQLVWLSGAELFTAEGQELTAMTPGTAHVMLRHTTRLGDNQAYDLYTAPIAIEIKAADVPLPPGGIGSYEPEADNGCSEPQAGSAVIHAAADSDCSRLLREAFSTKEQVEVAFQGELLELEADAWPEHARTEAGLLILSNELATYRFPAALWNPDEWERLTGRQVDELAIRFIIREPNEELHRSAMEALSQSGGSLASGIVEFEVELTDGEGGIWPIPFGRHYAERDMKVHSTNTEASRLTVLQYMPDTGSLHFVPAAFTMDPSGSGMNARLKRNGNSMYLVAAYDRSFQDMAHHWAREHVHLAASKGLLQGKSDSAFAPQDAVTRAEFAAMLVRALGLTPIGTSESFNDVPGDAWYAMEVTTAKLAGLIVGYEDHSFRPDAYIRREEAVAMLMRALAYAGTELDKAALQPNELEKRFLDAKDFVWAHEEASAALAIGLLDGTDDGYLLPQRDMTRAEAATLLLRFLKLAKFI